MDNLKLLESNRSYSIVYIELDINNLYGDYAEVTAIPSDGIAKYIKRKVRLIRTNGIVTGIYPDPSCSYISILKYKQI